MSWEAWLTIAVLAVTIVLLVREVTAPSGVAFGAVVVLLVAGVIDTRQALAGFSNPAPITVAALYVVAAGIERTGVLNRLVDSVIGRAEGERATLSRLLIPSAGASAFLNNTPIVAMLSPAVSRWAQRAGTAVSRLLMPLSFAAILGGMLTVVGTSTNIVVSGLLEDSGLEPLGFFEVAKIGLPVAIVGIAFIVVLAPLALPDRRPARSDIEDVREFMVEVTVVPGGPVDGMSIQEAGLRHLAGVYLVQVEREGRAVAAVGPDFALAGSDTLRFVGNAFDVADLQERPGIEPVASQAGGLPSGLMVFYEAIVGVGSTLVGRSLRDVGFRQRYQAAVIAIHRADQRVSGKLGDTQLRVGDTLLVLATREFREQWHRSADFLLVSRLDATDPARTSKAVPALFIGVAVVSFAAFGVFSIFEAALLGAAATVFTGVLTTEEARSAVDLDVVILIASSFGLGAALTTTGLAQRLADWLVAGLDGLGGPVVLVGIAVTTIALTELITNNAAAVLVFPIALAVAADTGADPRAFAVTVALVASASFLTPIGYQTNTMVWGPGGYRFGDYARLGLPLTLTTLVSVAVAAPLWWAI
jgi:di/tricarboxylate transporter